MAAIRVGCAGWALRTDQQHRFSDEGSHLERYARVFNAVEINSSFYRPHRTATYARWAAATPPGFAFSVKLPREITHERRLVDIGLSLDRFASEVAGLGDRFQCLLIQLPPSLAFDASMAVPFLAACRTRFQVDIVCEARHESWFGKEGAAALQSFDISDVIADPVVAGAGAGRRNGSVRYFRMHGSPRIYYSPYDDAALQTLAVTAGEAGAVGRTVWCIFDNTALGHAVADAMKLAQMIGQRR